jgi:hypothetical protein
MIWRFLPCLAVGFTIGRKAGENAATRFATLVEYIDGNDTGGFIRAAGSRA